MHEEFARGRDPAGGGGPGRVNHKLSYCRDLIFVAQILHGEFAQGREVAQRVETIVILLHYNNGQNNLITKINNKKQ